MYFCIIKIKRKLMWDEYNIRLRDNSMTFMAQLIVWQIFWSFILGIITVDTIYFASLIVIFVGVYIWAKQTYSRTPVEVIMYIKCLFKNKTPKVKYYLPEWVEESQVEQRIYKLEC
jgi:hypothetical protein